jgi:uncharacterized phage protein gp47/JayE
MSWFRSPSEIEADMLADLEALTGLKLSSSDVSREEVIKIKQMSIALSHATAQIDRAADDFFPGSATLQALRKHLQTRQMPDQELAQPSKGTIEHTGVAGTVILAGNRVRQKSSGKLFFLLADATIGLGGTVDALYQSVLSGSDQNVDVVNDDFEMVSPQANVDDACTNITRFLDGRDDETAAEILARIQAHDQGENTGGNLEAYEAFAKAASDAVVTAKSIKAPRGPDTVDTVITAGTTDIEAAVRSGNAVERVPSDALVATVQAYIVARNPTTDDHQTVKPIEDNFDSTITYDLFDETQRTAVDAEITKIWQIFVYSAKSDETVDPTTLERQIDGSVGHLIVRRRVSNFGGGSPQYTVPSGHILKPHTLTLQAF